MNSSGTADTKHLVFIHNSSPNFFYYNNKFSISSYPFLFNLTNICMMIILKYLWHETKFIELTLLAYYLYAIIGQILRNGV